MYKLYFSFSYFSSQLNRRVFHPSNFSSLYFFPPTKHTQKKINSLPSSHYFLYFHFFRFVFSLFSPSTCETHLASLIVKRSLAWRQSSLNEGWLCLSLQDIIWRFDNDVLFYNFHESIAYSERDEGISCTRHV